MTPNINQDTNPNDNIIGPLSGIVTLINYFNFTEEDSKVAYSSLNKVLNAVGDTTTLVLRNFVFPQDDLAMEAAAACEAAGKQGKYFEFYTNLFEEQGKWQDLKFYAKKVGLDINQFDKDRFSQEIQYKIRNDLQSAIDSGVEEAPTLFINGQLYEGLLESQRIINAINNIDIKDPAKGIISTLNNTALDYQRDDPDTYLLNPMPLDDDSGYNKEEPDILYKNLRPGITLDEYEPSIEDQDFSDPEPS